MKTIIFSDLHCNFPVLEALTNLEKNVDTWISAGDAIGIFPFINETLDLLRELNVTPVLGDHEDALLNNKTLPQSFTATESINKQISEISSRNLEYLNTWNIFEKINIDGRTLGIVHNINDSNQEKYLIDFEECTRKYAGFEYLIFGHTHFPTLHSNNSLNFLNPGSLGFPVSNRRKYSYIVLENGNFAIREFIVDNKKLINRIIETGYNKKYIAYLEAGFVWPM